MQVGHDALALRVHRNRFDEAPTFGPFGRFKTVGEALAQLTRKAEGAKAGQLIGPFGGQHDDRSERLGAFRAKRQRDDLVDSGLASQRALDPSQGDALAFDLHDAIDAGQQAEATIE